MRARKVFISYSHKDAELFAELMLHLEPFRQEMLLQPWSDREIGPSESWSRRIREEMEGADAALLLVSPYFLASKFITEEEVPRLIEAREAERLVLTVLYLDHASAEVRKFPVVDSETGERGIAITKYQGLNDPADPVMKHAGASRSELLKRCAGKLRVLLAAQSGRREQRRQLEGRELIIELRLRGGHVDRRYSRPHFDDLRNDSGPIDLSHVERLSARSAGEQTELELGRELFKILFSDDESCLRVLRLALGEQVRSPLRPAVRVRILTSDPGLRALPWPLTAWRETHLAEIPGWTFELATDRHPQPMIHLYTPCSAVMLGAEPKGFSALDLETHALCLEALFRRAWNNPMREVCLARARTLTAARSLLAAQPRLVYVYAHARAGSELELLLEDDEGRPAAVPFSTVAGWWGDRPPQVVFLNTVGEASLAPALPRVPLLYHQRSPAPVAQLRRDAQLWWESVLGEGWQPVRAFHELGGEARRRGCIATAFEQWETKLSDHTPKVDRARAFLDRRTQRQAIWDAVRELVHHRQRRVSCVIAYGSSGSLVHHFAVQAMATLKDWASDLARIEHHDLRFPDQREDASVADFEERFRDVVGLQPGQGLEAALKPGRRGGPRAKPVLLFDWGCYGPGQLAALHSPDLEAWATFCCHYLAPACPVGMRVVSYVALVADEARHGDLLDLIEALREEETFRQPYFELLTLPALGEVTPNDLARFFEVEENTSCPTEYLHDLPERITQKTGGDFEATIKLIENAEREMGWPDLYRNLPPAEKPARKRKDFKIE